jgi:hypothetical protein
LIEDRETAKYVLQLFLEINNQMDKSIDAIENKGSPAEFKTYKNGIGYVRFEVFERIIVPLCERHPSLKPPEMETLKCHFIGISELGGHRATSVLTLKIHSVEDENGE